MGPTAPFVFSGAGCPPDLDPAVWRLLQAVGLEAEYAKAFCQHRITADLLDGLDTHHLLQVGVKALGRRWPSRWLTLEPTRPPPFGDPGRMLRLRLRLSILEN